MNKQILMGVIRHVLTTVGGVIAANGYFGLEPDNVQQIVGVLLAVIGSVWSVLDKNTSTPVSAEPVQIPPVIDPVTTTIHSEPDIDAVSGYRLSSRSKGNLEGVNPKLRSIVETAIELTGVDFAVTEGLRTAERQAELVAANKSWVKVSRHQDGGAIDVAAFPEDYPGDVSWEAKHYAEINKAMQKAAAMHNCRITWGGHWKQRDYCHFQFESEIASK